MLTETERERNIQSRETESDRETEVGGQPALNVSTLTRYKQISQMKEISKSYRGTEPEPAGYQDGQYKERLMVSLPSVRDSDS